MNKNKAKLVFAIVAVLAGSVLTIVSQDFNKMTVSDRSPNPVDFFEVKELSRGMRGIAHTVFEGSTAEQFNVEILGVVPGGIGPQQDMIVGRISGGKADRTQVFAGMSGSPVYIDGKLLGAIAFAYPYSKEAICGITPIGNMIEIFEKNNPDLRSNIKPSALAKIDIKRESGLISEPNPRTVLQNSEFSKQGFVPIATPLTFSGFEASTVDKFSNELTNLGFLPVAGRGAASRITPLKPFDDKTLLGGDSVMMQLARGDYSLSAAGTVTMRNGEKIYAFGHPFLGLGNSSLPMSESHVITVVPSLYNSFKITVPDSLVGSMTQDRATGVYGALGEVPNMIPVQIDIETSRNQLKSYKFEIARDATLTPLLMNMTILNSITASERQFGGSTIAVNGTIDIKNNIPLRIERLYTGGLSPQLAASAITNPLRLISQSGFDDLKIERINIGLRSLESVEAARLEKLSVNRAQAKPGETIEVKAFIRKETGEVLVQKIPFMIPLEIPKGTLSISVGDGISVEARNRVASMKPTSAVELIKLINSQKESGRLYIQAHRLSKGAVIGTSEMSNLPPSVLATINNSRTTGGYDPTVKTIVFDKALPTTGVPIGGIQSVSIEITN